MKIACIGEAMIELSLVNGSSDASVNYAGDTFNTAVYLKRNATPQLDVHYITALGTDTFSDQIVSKIESEQLNTEYLARTPDRVPGLYAINTDDQGERSFTYWRDQSAARLLFSDQVGPDMRSLLDFDVIYYSAITLAILPVAVKEQLLTILAEYRTMPDKRVCFDSNYRPRLWASQDEARHYTTHAWQNCDIALPSADDEMDLYGDSDEAAVVDRLHRFGVERGALKRGATGPIDLGSNPVDVEFPTVSNVVDSTAAGDSFNGAYLAKLLEGGSSSDAMLAGHRCASHVIQFKGAIVD